MTYDQFIRKVQESFPEISKEQCGQFQDMAPLYEDWNSKINVISRKDIDALYEHHVLHSLALAKYLKEKCPDIYESFANGGIRVLDLGTGGGFPGIPLAILFPKTHFTLCDSVGKKILVADTIAKSLSLSNVDTVNARAESLTGPYEYVVSRAVASLEEFYPWVKGKFSKGILYLKGGEINEEIAAMMGRFKMRQGSVRTWQVDNWLTDDYFVGKFVIHIER
jgi:16S rRNA (guanine527-N7)-methyltransferase